MKKGRKQMPDVDMSPEYDFRRGIRGKYAQRYAEGTNVVMLDPDVAAVFPNAESVNEALRVLVKIVRANGKARTVKQRP